MIKKIGTATALSAALLFGGAFAGSADAQSDINTNAQYKVVYSINGEKGSLTGEDKQKMIHQMMYKLDNCVTFDWLNVEEGQKTEEKQPVKVEQPKQEQPKQEQPVKEEPKQEQATEVKQPETTPAPQQPVQQPEQQPKQEQTQSELSQFEQQVVELTNQERANHGLAPLQIDEDLSKVAREKSRDMAANNYFSHTSPTYGSPFDMMNQYGISYSSAGENIAQGQTTPAQVVDAWMNSEGHRANILNGDYTHIGVGYVEDGNHWTQMFIGK